MPNSESSQFWQQVCEAGNFERHFNQLQANYRALASSWLLATFAGVGWIIANQKNIPFPGDWPLAVRAIGFATKPQDVVAVPRVGIGLATTPFVGLSPPGCTGAPMP